MTCLHKQTVAPITHRRVFARWPLIVGAWVVIVAQVGIASATSYVMVADEDLVDEADVIARVRVDSKNVVTEGSRILTEFELSVQRLLKGGVATRSIRVRRLGGVAADGRFLILPGAPDLRPGESALVFLVDNGDGTWEFKHSELGLFRIAVAGTREVAYRQLADTDSRPVSPGRLERRPSLRRAHLARDLQRFTRWIEQRVSGSRQATNYYSDVEPSSLPSAITKFTLFADEAGNNYHWHQFTPEVDGEVAYAMHRRGVIGLRQRGARAVRRALRAWDRVFLINTKYAGRATASAGLTGRDGVNAFLFRDPNNEIEGTYDCTVGGVLARGGIKGVVGPIHGAVGSGENGTYWDILEGDVVFQDGIECLSERSVEEAAGHEIGHTLGLRHSCADDESGPCDTALKGDALMRAVLHGDERGAAIRADDRAGAWALDYDRARFGFFGELGTYFNDVTGGGRADAIAVNRGRITIRRSNGASFEPNDHWTSGPFFGEVATVFADVTGDGRHDALAVNHGRITVRRSNGASFEPNDHWTSGPFFGDVGTFFADVTGDGRTDAIAVNRGRVTVRRSNGASFEPNDHWTSGPFFGDVGTFFADVTGDGRADAIAVNRGRVTVRRSNGAGFEPNDHWTAGPFFGEVGTFFADVTGDRRVDAIAVNRGRITVRRSNGAGFEPNDHWTEGPFFGEVGTFFADVTGDGLADAIAVNVKRITVRRSNGETFEANTHWTYTFRR